jgi:LmbE family N-acetylglucosaminyl deacetylase
MEAVEHPAERDGPSLYVFAHNDDELSAFLRLRADVRRGCEVHVVWLTESLFLARPGQRPRESEGAMRLLGVPGEQLHFWGSALGTTGNGSLLVRLGAAVERLTALIRDLGPTTIATTAFEGGHVEHDAAHAAAVLAARRAESRAALVETAWYTGYRSRTIAFFRPPPAPTASHTDWVGAAEVRLLWRLLRCYPSQAVQLHAGFGRAIVRLLRHGAPFRAIPPRSYLERPHAGRLLYERHRRWLHESRFAARLTPLIGWPSRFTFADFRRAVAAVALSLGVPAP